MIEVVFEVQEEVGDGGFVALAMGHAIATQAENLETLRENVREAVQCHFGDGIPGQMPQIIRLRSVHEEVLVV